MGSSLVSERIPTNLRHRLEGVIAGDAGSCQWLYQEFAGRILRRLRQRYKHSVDLEPEDLLHEVFLFYFRRADRIFRRFLDRKHDPHPTIATFERYLWDQACGVAANYRRSARNGPLLVELTRDHCDPAATERRIVDCDRCRVIGRALQAGDSQVYLYFKLRFVEGLSPSEIGAVTGWNRPVIYNLRLRLVRTVQRLVAEGMA